jgi:hypothetical protein
MTADPIVAEVRQARVKLLAEAGGTLDALFAWLAEAEAASGRDTVRRSPRFVTEADAPSASTTR